MPRPVNPATHGASDLDHAPRCRGHPPRQHHPRPSDRTAAIGLDLALVAAGVALMTIASQISIPSHPVPLTGGTFGALLIGGLYGLRRAFLTLATYLVLGVVGLGLFADWSGGGEYFTGSTGVRLLERR